MEVWGIQAQQNLEDLRLNALTFGHFLINTLKKHKLTLNMRASTLKKFERKAIHTGSMATASDATSPTGQRGNPRHYPDP